MTLYSVYRVGEKHQVRNFWLPGSAWRLSIKVEHFRINILDCEEKYGKISDYRTFNYFKTVSSRRTFSYFIVGTSATLTFCITILICYFAWTTTSTTLSSASSSPRAGNFNWPLVLFDKDGKLQWKKKCMNENVVEQHFHFKLTNREALNVLCSVIKHAGGG